MSLNLSDFYLNDKLDEFEWICTCLASIMHDFIDKWNLKYAAFNEIVLAKVMKQKNCSQQPQKLSKTTWFELLFHTEGVFKK